MYDEWKSNNPALLQRCILPHVHEELHMKKILSIMTIISTERFPNDDYRIASKNGVAYL